MCVLLCILPLKGHGNEPDFPRFLHLSVRHRSLTLNFEPFRFWLRILGDIHIRKTTPRLNDTGSRRLSVSMIRGVGDSPTQRYGESTTLRITDMQSWRLPASPIRRVGYWIFLKKTRCIGDTESRRLRVSLIRRVADSPYHWFGESPDSVYRLYGESPTPRIVESGSRWLGDTGVARWKKKFV